ncbi:hypothetical protein E2C01_076712 [Portunus trituberculatus]|uniref:Uncharacterized protein n=1 Tax=Portunus trituberculatus TaxID=210409 RepID=A0A5B7IMR7_PORTR|nr:hypothetical protein [Portunus trituberculatus]
MLKSDIWAPNRSTEVSVSNCTASRPVRTLVMPRVSLESPARKSMIRSNGPISHLPRTCPRSRLRAGRELMLFSFLIFLIYFFLFDYLFVISRVKEVLFVGPPISEPTR